MSHTKILTFRERYERAIPILRKEFGFTNLNAVPRVAKVVVNVGVGSAARDAKDLDLVVKTIERATGQKPVLTKARKSIASFKIREGIPIGVMVTLRGKRMEQFVEKLIHATLPRVRDFQGLPTSGFSTAGTFTMGLKEHLVFPEISTETIDKIHGLGITVQTTATKPAEAKALLAALGFPFRTGKD